ncbi:MAG: type VII secretion protein EccC [Actinobacteria bacterium 13_1_20CM_3_71_11]|nr:MAG: type VII secretion protein EccC [Actinobacteria bacterium 13_1_20CM_3_71_11]
MATVVVQRRARRPAPEIPSGELAVPAPPELPRQLGSRWGQLLLLLPMLTGTVATAMMFAGRQGGAYSYVVGAVFGVSSLGMLATGFGSGAGLPRKAEMMAARRDYLRHLSVLRRKVRDTADRQRDGLHYRHPDPTTLWSTVDSHRLWERRPGDADFAVVRVGTGPQTLATPLVPPATASYAELEPMTSGALRRFLDTYSVVPDLPVAVSFRGFARLHLQGPEERTRALARAMLAQLTVFHAPEDLLIAACVAPERRPEWEHLKWLPHALHPMRTDGLGAVRLVADSAVELENLLDDVLANRPRFNPSTPGEGPQVVVVLDGGDLTGSQHLTTEGGLAGVALLDLDHVPPRLLDRASIALTVAADGALASRSADEEGTVGVADGLDAPAAVALARQLAPLRLAATHRAGDSPLQSDTGLPELLGIGDAQAYEARDAWAPRPHRSRLRVPIGTGTDGQPVELDLKESAQDGMGPHGLLIGATGSGKSELLRTLVLGLAATHDSETLNVVLIDFKGGATFASMDRLPHTAAMITNLEAELPLVDRMNDALEGELNRRQELLRRAGNFASLRDYEKARAGGAPLAPLPILLVVCDEFSELLARKPEFIDLFVQIGRVGRSLGVHLLLASQRLEEGRLRGLDTHLSYRIGLPGHGYLKSGTEPLVRFRAAYVSGPYRRPGTPTVAPGRVLDYTTHPLALPTPVPVQPAPSEGTPSLLDVLVGRLAGAGVPAHQVWLPPLQQSVGLDELLGPLITEPALGLTVANPQLRGALQVPVALVDKPYEQRRDLLWLTLSGGTGHVAVVGGPQSGKSTLLRTVLCGLSLTHTPARVHVYCLDFGGGGLAGLRELPHVGGVAGRQEPAAVRRTVGEVATLLAERERDGAAPEGRAAVFLVVDGWSTIRGEYEDLEPVITDIATRGLSYGVHLVASASRWMDFRPAIRDLFGSRLELRLGDTADSAVSRKAADNVPKSIPGRGITTEGLHFLTATAGDDLVKAVATTWTGPVAPRVRLLPAVLPYDQLGDGPGIPIGIAEADLLPVGLDFAAEPHFLVFGDAESGKSSFLRALATTIARRHTPEQARLVIVDYRRSLLGAIDSEHLIGYASGGPRTAELIDAVAGYMQARLPGPDVTPQQLRDRSWWTGPDCYVLVDDYDLVATGPSNPLQPLLDHLAQARDIGLHLVLTRRSGGAGRALYEPVIQRLRELSSPGLVLSGDRDEGALLGTVRPAPLPPGRGWLVTRRDGARLIQLAHLPPA